MLVRAKEKGYYGNAICEPGKEFHIRSESELGSWMEPIDATTVSVSVGVDLKKDREKKG